MNENTNNFNQQDNNGTFNNSGQQNYQNMNNGTFNNSTQQNYQNMNNGYYQNESINQNNSGNPTTFNANLQGNNVYQQPINQNNIPYNNKNTTHKQNKFKIIGIVAVIVVVLFVGILLLGVNGSNGGTKSGTTVNQGQELKIKSDYVDINLTVETVERNVKLENMLGEEEVFTKIKVSIVNNDKDDSFIGTFIGYELFDQNQNLLEDSNCKTATWMFLYDVSDAHADEIPANSTGSGYLYCSGDNNLGKILGVTSFTAFDEELIQQGHLKSTDSDIFYVSLK